MYNWEKITLDKIASVYCVKMLNYPRDWIFFLGHLYGSHHKHIKLGNANMADPRKSNSNEAETAH